MNNILWNGKMRVENQTKTLVWEDSSLCPETLTKNAVQEFHLRIEMWQIWSLIFVPINEIRQSKCKYTTFLSSSSLVGSWRLKSPKTVLFMVLKSGQHCTENLIYIFPEMKLCGLIPNSYIHVSVNVLYILGKQQACKPLLSKHLWLAGMTKRSS